jgi:outer membrane protein TolC
MNPEAELLKPASGIPLTGINEITRPELNLYKLQDSLYRQQDRVIDSRLRPKVSLFANGGYGKPGLNMMKNEFAPFVTTGLRINWNIGGLYTQKKDRELNDIYRQEVLVQQENFLLNTQAQLIQQQSVIRKLQRTMQTDLQIIDLKKQVKESAKAQLDNGVITASDYLREVHAEDQARQNLTLHRLQLLHATIQYQTIAGK